MCGRLMPAGLGLLCPAVVRVAILFGPKLYMLKSKAVSHARFAHPDERKPEFLAVVREALWSAVPRHRFEA
jgi:hypothetical protein